MPNPSPRLLPLPIAVLIGVVGGLVAQWGFPEPGWWPLAILGVTALLLALRGGVWRCALIGFAWGISFFLPHLVWADLVVGSLPWIALSVAESIMVAMFAIAWSLVSHINWVASRRWTWPLVAGALWTAMEEARSAVPFGGFPWGRIAFSQADSPIGRLAWLGGVPLVTFVSVAIASVLAVSVLALGRGRLMRAEGGLALAAGLAVVAVFLPLSAAPESGTINVAAVQGNSARAGLDAYSERREVLDNHVKETLAMAAREQGLDLVVWPENSSDIDPTRDQSAWKEIDSAAQAVNAPILVGTQEFGENAQGEKVRWNVSLVWIPLEGPIDSYAKRHPAPFAEYIPMRDFFRFFSDKVDLVTTQMVPGTGNGVVHVPIGSLDREVVVGDVICFEVAYDSLVRDAVDGGAEILAVQTNNANFGFTNESVQQLAMSKLRAIEHGRSVVHASTVGVSAIFAPDGKTLASGGHYTAESLTSVVPLRTSLTPSDRLGQWLPWGIDIAAVMLIAWGIWAGVRRRS